MVKFVLKLCSELGTWTIFANLNQKRQAVISDNQLAKAIKSKSIRGLEAERQMGGVGAKPQHETGGLKQNNPTNPTKSCVDAWTYTVLVWMAKGMWYARWKSSMLYLCVIKKNHDATS